MDVDLDLAGVWERGMKDITVWHVFGTMDVGGAELRTLELGAALAPSGIRFEYVTLSGRSGVLDDRIHDSGGRIHPISLGLTFPLRFFLALRRGRPHVLEGHVATFSGALILLAWLARVPVRIAHFRSDGDGHPDTLRRRSQRSAMVWLIDKFATDIVGVSPESLSSGYRADWEADARALVIPNGLGPAVAQSDAALRTSLHLDFAGTLLLHVGRPSPEKNRPLAVRVLHALRAAGEDAHLVLVGGTGTDARELADTIARLDVLPYVHELGRRHDARSLMAQADVLILTSVREGLPGVVLEALSVGTPVVSAWLPGVAFIQKQTTGVEIVESADTVGWVSAVRRATSAKGAAAERDRIRQAFERGAFSIERSCEAHQGLYRRGAPQ